MDKSNQSIGDNQYIHSTTQTSNTLSFYHGFGPHQPLRKRSESLAAYLSLCSEQVTNVVSVLTGTGQTPSPLKTAFYFFDWKRRLMTKFKGWKPKQRHKNHNAKWEFYSSPPYT